jgi:hypothetical protein
MASIASLQKAIDNNAIDVSTLNREQLMGLDRAFQTGILKGYPNVGAMMEEQGAAATTLAKEKEQKLRPFEAATGLKRLDFELVGDVAGSLMPYIQDRNKIAQAFISSGGKANYGLERLGGSAYKMSDLASKVMIPFKRTAAGKAIGMLGRTAAVWNRVARGIDKATKQFKYGVGGKGGQMFYGPSQLLQTELKSQALGMAGAGMGSITYGVAEALTDQGGATHEDLARVSENEIDKLAPVDQEIVHASRAMSNAMLFNAGGFLLIPFLGGIGNWTKGILGMKGKQAEIIAKNAYKYGYDTNLSAVMNENHGAFAGFVRQFNKSVGVFPWIAGKRQKFRNDLEVQFYNNYLDNINATIPMSHAQLLALGSVNQFRRNFQEMFNVISTKYDKVLDATKYHGLEDLKIVPTKHIGVWAEEVLDQIQRRYPALRGDIMGITARTGAQQPVSELDDPLIAFVRELKWLREQGDNITAQQALGLQKMLTKILPSTKMDDPRSYVQALRTALEKDWASIGGGNPMQELLKSKTVKAAFDAQVAQGGAQAGEAYIGKLMKGIDEVQKAQLEANSFFHNSIMPYYSTTAKTVRRVDSEIFTNLGLVGITGRATINPDEMWDKAIRSVFRSKSSMAIKDLKTLMGYGKNKTGTEMFDRFRELYIYDAFKSSFKYAPRALEEKSLFSLLEEAKSSGIMNRRYIDEINDEFVSDTWLKGINPEKLLKSGIGDKPWKALKVGANEVQGFDVEQFAKNLGLNGADTEIAAAKNKLIQMYGGGKTGEQALDHLETMIQIMRREAEVGIADPSVFVQRKLTLGAAGGMSLGQGVARGTLLMGSVGGGFGGLAGSAALILLGRKLGGWLGDPAALKRTYDLFTEIERLDQKIGGEGVSKMLFDSSEEGGKVLRRLFGQWWNSMADEDKDMPRVNPNKINFEEIQNYLNSSPEHVPAPVWNKDALIPSVKQRSYNLETALSKASTPALAAGDNFLIGVRNGLQKEMEATDADRTILAGGTPPPVQTPGQQVTGPDPTGGSFANIAQGTGNRAAQYQSLWPQDSLGQGIATKNA